MSVNHGRNSYQKRRLKLRLFNGLRHKPKPCCFCRRRLSFDVATLEHVVPLSKGGSWDIDNLRISCQNCNSERANEEFSTFKNKKMVCFAIIGGMYGHASNG